MTTPDRVDAMVDDLTDLGAIIIKAALFFALVQAFRGRWAWALLLVGVALTAFLLLCAAAVLIAITTTPRKDPNP